MKNHREDVNSNDENKKGAAYLMKWRKKIATGYGLSALCISCEVMET